MDDTTAVLGWAALGLSVSFVAMILPFKPGAGGVALNVFVAVAAAMAGGAIGRALGFYERLAAPLSFGFAVATALVVTLLVHVVVVKRDRRPRATS